MMKKITRPSEDIIVHYSDVHSVQAMSHALTTYIQNISRPLIVLCIGTDRSTGDSLGPLTGTLLSQIPLRHLHVYGTLHAPIHALNLQEQLDTIKRTYRNPFIIALDASLGNVKSIGHLIASHHPLRPGAALNKELPAVGDISLTGVVNVGGTMGYAVLQSTRLSVVHDMARHLASTLQRTDRALQGVKTNEKLSM